MFRAGVQRSAAVDIWAFGVLCVELLTGRDHPWFAQDYPQLMAAVLIDKKFPAIPDDLPGELGAHLAGCFEHDPVNRPHAAALVQQLEPLAQAGSDEKTLLSMHANALLQGSWVSVTTLLSRLCALMRFPETIAADEFPGKLPTDENPPFCQNRPSGTCTPSSACSTWRWSPIQKLRRGMKRTCSSSQC